MSARENFFLLATCLLTACLLTACGASETSNAEAETATDPETATKDASKAKPAADGDKPKKKRKRNESVHSTSNEMKNLRAMAYANATFDPNADQRGVTIYDKERASDGYNFYSSRGLPAAFLLNMEGELVYQWRRKDNLWQHVDLLPNGDVIVLIKDNVLFKVNLESDILWRYRARVHHDHFRHPDGRIFVLTRKNEKHPDLHPEHLILVDYVTVLSEDGELIEEYSILELLQRSRFAFLLPSVSHHDWTKPNEEPGDVVLDFLHTNHVEVVDERLADRSPIFEPGMVILSMRHLNSIVVADLEKREVVWLWGPTNLTRQHHPTVLDNGNILLFNNGLKKSSILELDPVSLKVVWRYMPGPEFFTMSRGSNQRLPNGNTLITESDPGYVFEVTPEGETVWEFANPQVNEKDERSAIWRMVRFQREELPFLETLEK